MGTIIHKTKKNHLYYYYVESARVNGKPRIVRQIYLGRAEEIVKVFEENKKGKLEKPKYSIVLEFGAICAVFDLAKQLDVVGRINRLVPKRNQGLSVGDYILLTAINRAVEPVSKMNIADWYDKTILSKLIPAQKSWLKSQRFWDHMGLLSETAMKQFQDEFCTLIVNKYGLPTDCLIYDTTNFFTYIDTCSESKLAKRGHCKSKRTDLKIVGLAMMVSPDFNVPLFHETYSGNIPDPIEFHNVIDRLKDRLKKIGSGPGCITLVFDKGNNSEDNMDLVFSGDNPFHVVGSLKLSKHKELLDISKKQFEIVPEYKDRSVTAYRCIKDIYNRKTTVVLVHNPELLKGQLQGIMLNIEKCTLKLQELKGRLQAWSEHRIIKGKKPTISSVKKNVDQILHAEYVSDLFIISVTKLSGVVDIDFHLDSEKLENIKERYLGKNLLFTDNHDWGTSKIISAYRSQYHIESAFRQMKDTTFLDVRPIYHWTDQKINVHAFYCVLALQLCSLLNRTLYKQGISLSIDRMLSTMVDVKQVIEIYPKKGDSKKDREVYSLTKVTPEQKKIIDIFNIRQYVLDG
jgi:transposase